MPNNLVPQNFDQWMRTMERRMTRLEAVGQPRTSTPQRIILPGTPDAQLLPSNQPPLQIGDAAGAYLRMDSNEITTGNAGAAVPLHLNPEGGDVVVGVNTTLNTNVKIGATAGNGDLQPALQLSRSRPAGKLVETILYQASNDLAQTSIQIRENGVAQGTFVFAGTANDSGNIRNRGADSVLRHITPFALQIGSFTRTSAIAAGAGMDQAISLAASRFTQPPVILTGTQTQRLTIDTESVTTSGFTLRAYNFTSGGTSAGDIIIWWMAIQMISTNSLG